jgi:hypothetical protein
MVTYILAACTSSLKGRVSSKDLDGKQRTAYNTKYRTEVRFVFVGSLKDRL